VFDYLFSAGSYKLAVVALQLEAFPMMILALRLSPRFQVGVIARYLSIAPHWADSRIARRLMQALPDLGVYSLGHLRLRYLLAVCVRHLTLYTVNTRLAIWRSNLPLEQHGRTLSLANGRVRPRLCKNDRVRMKLLELSKDDQRTLREMRIFHPHARTRMGAQGVLRLSQGLRLQQTADEFMVHLNSVEQWR